MCGNVWRHEPCFVKVRSVKCVPDHGKCLYVLAASTGASVTLHSCSPRMLGTNFFWFWWFRICIPGAFQALCLKSERGHEQCLNSSGAPAFQMVFPQSRCIMVSLQQKRGLVAEERMTVNTWISLSNSHSECWDWVYGRTGGIGYGLSTKAAGSPCCPMESANCFPVAVERIKRYS